MLQLSVVFGEKVKKAVEQVSLSLYPLLCSVCDVHLCMLIAHISRLAGSLTQGCVPRTE